jgi:hypothetical protein
MILTRGPRARRDRDGRHAAGVGDPHAAPRAPAPEGDGLPRRASAASASPPPGPAAAAQADHRADIRDVKEPCAGFGARPPANRAANGIGRPVLSDSGAATVAGSGAGGPIAAADRSLGLGNGRLDGGYGSSGASGLSRINSSSATTARQGGGVCVTHWS